MEITLLETREILSECFVQLKTFRKFDGSMGRPGEVERTPHLHPVHSEIDDIKNYR